MDVVVDDHLLLEVLLGEEPRELRPSGGRVFTTGLWYHRLCRAVSDSTVLGVMSRRLGESEPSVAASVAQAITALPDSIILTSLGELAWPMAEILQQGARLNLMSLEALAAAEHHDAELCLAVSDQNPQLLVAANARGRPVRYM